jgi:DNA-directed RNA polymerase specialized sigma24 family protein
VASIREEYKQLTRSLDQLPEALRKVIYLYYFEHRTLAEIGQSRKQTEIGARKARNRALARLRQLLVEKSTIGSV